MFLISTSIANLVLAIFYYYIVNCIALKLPYLFKIESISLETLFSIFFELLEHWQFQKQFL